MLFKPKNNINRFDSALIFGLILAVIALIVQPKPGAHAETVSKANISQDSLYSISLEESLEGRLFFPPVKTPDKVIKGLLTGYSSTPDQTDSSPFIAADGTRVYDGMVANNCLPFGTKIKIPSLYGDKLFTIHDRMNKRYGCGKFDIWFDAPKKEVMKFGVQRAEVQVFLKKKTTEVAVK